MTSQSLPVFCVWSWGFVPQRKWNLTLLVHQNTGKENRCRKFFFAILFSALGRFNGAKKGMSYTLKFAKWIAMNPDSAVFLCSNLLVLRYLCFVGPALRNNKRSSTVWFSYHLGRTAKRNYIICPSLKVTWDVGMLVCFAGIPKDLVNFLFPTLLKQDEMKKWRCG